MMTLPRRALRKVRDAIRGETAQTYFDIHDPRVLRPLLAHYGVEPSFDPATSTQRVRRVYELRFDLRDVFPLALTPQGRGKYLEWLLAHGRPDLGLRDDEILAWLFEADADPSRGLAATWTLQPAWQRAVPDALTPAGWPRLKRWLADEYNVTSRWVRNAKLPPQPSINPSTGVNVLAHFRYPSGLQEAAVAAVRGLDSAGVATARRDLPVRFECDWADTERYQSVEVCDTSIVCAAVNTFLDQFLPESGLHIRPGVRRIAIWYWELDRLPTEWVERIERTNLVDEVWAPTRFIADALSSSLKLPIVPMLPGVELPPFAPQPRRRFGLDESKFLFMFMFDMNSAMTRKNPLGLIEAYRRAFPDREAALAIKVSRASSDPANRDALVAACRSAGVTLIDEVLPRGDVLALLNCADSYVSLHRSEGFGLTLAEAMLLGKPTIGTAYSGNLDFMTAETSYLVPFELVPLTENLAPYPQGCRWAEPSIEDAARLMRHVFEHREESRRVGEAGREHVRELLSISAAGERMAARLADGKSSN